MMATDSSTTRSKLLRNIGGFLHAILVIFTVNSPTYGEEKLGSFSTADLITKLTEESNQGISSHAKSLERTIVAFQKKPKLQDAEGGGTFDKNISVLRQKHLSPSTKTSQSFDKNISDLRNAVDAPSPK